MCCWVFCRPPEFICLTSFHFVGNPSLQEALHEKFLMFFLSETRNEQLDIFTFWNLPSWKGTPCVDTLSEQEECVFFTGEHGASHESQDSPSRQKKKFVKCFNSLNTRLQSSRFLIRLSTAVWLLHSRQTSCVRCTKPPKSAIHRDSFLWIAPISREFSKKIRKFEVRLILRIAVGVWSSVLFCAWNSWSKFWWGISQNTRTWQHCGNKKLVINV